MRLFFAGAFALSLFACGDGGDEARLGAHDGEATYRVYAGDGSELSARSERTSIELASEGGDLRRITIPAFGCSFSAKMRSDGQYESFAALPGCDLRRVGSGETVALGGGNVSFYEDGDGDPLVLLHGTLALEGDPLATWTWTFAATRER